MVNIVKVVLSPVQTFSSMKDSGVLEADSSALSNKLQNRVVKSLSKIKSTVAFLIVLDHVTFEKGKKTIL